MAQAERLADFTLRILTWRTAYEAGGGVAAHLFTAFERLMQLAMTLAMTKGPTQAPPAPPRASSVRASDCATSDEALTYLGAEHRW